MLPLLALSTPRGCASSSESSSCGDSDSSSDSESSSEHGAATTLALDASTLDGVDTGRRGGGGGRSRGRSRSKPAKQRKRAKKRLKKQRKRAEKERMRMEKRRKKREEEGREMDDYEDDYRDGVLCFDEREWERYLGRGVYELPELRGRGKKECMSREEWMELHDAHTAAAAATPTAAGVQGGTSPCKTTNMR